MREEKELVRAKGTVLRVGWSEDMTKPSPAPEDVALVWVGVWDGKAGASAKRLASVKSGELPVWFYRLEWFLKSVQELGAQQTLESVLDHARGCLRDNLCLVREYEVETFLPANAMHLGSLIRETLEEKA